MYLSSQHFDYYLHSKVSQSKAVFSTGKFVYDLPPSQATHSPQEQRTYQLYSVLYLWCLLAHGKHSTNNH
jgi:hypothetical protein